MHESGPQSDVVTGTVAGGVAELARSVRRPGVLERADPTIEALPPTPLTDDARQRLFEWGFSPLQVEELRQHTSSMRYDLVPQRVQRIADNGMYIYTPPGGREVMILPNFYDFNDSGDGQCGDLAIQLRKRILSDWHFASMNEYRRLRDLPALRLELVGGVTGAYFTEIKHYWLRLGLIDGGPAVDVDPSLQEISLNKSNSHVVLETERETLHLSTATFQTIGEYGDGFIDIKGTPIIGVSADRQVVYHFCPLKNRVTGRYHMFVRTLLPDGLFGPGRILEADRSIRTVADHKERPLAPAHMREMDTILRILEQAPIIVDDQSVDLLEPNRIIEL